MIVIGIELVLRGAWRVSVSISFGKTRGEPGEGTGNPKRTDIRQPIIVDEGHGSVSSFYVHVHRIGGGLPCSGPGEEGNESVEHRKWCRDGGGSGIVSLKTGNGAGFVRSLEEQDGY